MTSEPQDSQPKTDSAKTGSPKTNQSRVGTWWMIALVLAGVLTVGAAFLMLQRPAATPEPANTPLAETPEAEAETEAEARAEWEAQMQQVNAVVQSMERTALVGNSPTKGPIDAPVVLMKFSDFQCPFCAVAASEMKTFTAAHEEDVLYVYKHLPLVSIHEEALPAAKATWAAAQQDQFWLYHDGLFAYQEKLGEDYYVELAEQIGLEMAQFERDRNSSEAEAAVAQDAELASELGLRGTPSFLMTNSTDSFLLPGGAPLEIFDEATQRLKDAAAGG